MTRPAHGGVWPSARTRLAGVLGDPVRHSLSPALHNAAFDLLGLDWAYLAFEVPAGGATAAMAAVRALGVEGLSVTMPHKRAVAALVDRLSPTAAALGAVNTVVRQGDALVGESTDGAGFLDALRFDEGFDPTDKVCLVIGAGGSARAVVHVLGLAGAAEIVVVNRSGEAAEAAASLAGSRGRTGHIAEVRTADLVVNATPIGMALASTAAIDRQARPEKAPAIPLDPDLVRPGQLVVDLVYHPPITPLVQEARARGVAACNGVGMLVHQAAHAFKLWTGHEAPKGAMSAAALAALAHADDVD
ncbi:MAG TPA: shikimate dehydrogenase [Acidimicrobiales bacterium]|nr:shikimate dehydrogenase [Acidimicrobiales bacterium]